MLNNEGQLINILTRTSNRPRGFKNCYTSILKQTHGNVKHLVSYDSDADLTYLRKYPVDLIKVEQPLETFPAKDAYGNVYAPYNLYCNSLIDNVASGWIMFLDDDDSLLHNKVLEELDRLIEQHDEDTIFIWQMRYPNGSLLPTHEQIKNQIVKKNHIGSPCYLFHSKYKNKARWDAYKASDFRFLQQLLQIIPEHVYLPRIMVQINNFGDLGQRNDIRSAFKLIDEMPMIFYKNFYWSFIPKYHTRVFGRLVFHKKTYQNFFQKLFKSKKTTN